MADTPLPPQAPKQDFSSITIGTDSSDEDEKDSPARLTSFTLNTYCSDTCSESDREQSPSIEASGSESVQIDLAATDIVLPSQPKKKSRHKFFRNRRTNPSPVLKQHTGTRSVLDRSSQSFFSNLIEAGSSSEDEQPPPPPYPNTHITQVLPTRVSTATGHVHQPLHSSRRTVWVCPAVLFVVVLCIFLWILL